MSLTCPVCGYDKINEPKLKWSICPCCGTQFGLSDSGRTYAELRHDWIHKNHEMWQDGYVQPPPGWLASEQLWQAGLAVDAREGRTATAEIDLHEGNTLVWSGFIRENTGPSTLPRTELVLAGERIDAPVSFTVSRLSDLERKARTSRQGDIAPALKITASRT